MNVSKLNISTVIFKHKLLHSSGRLMFLIFFSNVKTFIAV